MPPNFLTTQGKFLCHMPIAFSNFKERNRIRDVYLKASKSWFFILSWLPPILLMLAFYPL